VGRAAVAAAGNRRTAATGYCLDDCEPERDMPVAVIIRFAGCRQVAFEVHSAGLCVPRIGRVRCVETQPHPLTHEQGEEGDDHGDVSRGGPAAQVLEHSGSVVD